MTLRARTSALWSRASRRERVLLGLGTIAVVGGLGYPFVWQPLARDLDRVEREAMASQAELIHARATVDEIAGLERARRPPRTADARAAVERIVAMRGLTKGLTALDAQQGRVRATFAAIELDAWAALIETLGREEQMFPVEALLTALVVPGSVRAEVVLARPSSP